MTTQHEAEDLIRDRKPFRASALSAVEGMSGTGDLPDEDARKYRDAEPTYTVLSYATPIAWVAADGTVCAPMLRYSLTTTQHQAIARHGLGIHRWGEGDPDGSDRRAVPAGHYEGREGW